MNFSKFLLSNQKESSKSNDPGQEVSKSDPQSTDEKCKSQGVQADKNDGMSYWEKNYMPLITERTEKKPYERTYIGVLTQDMWGYDDQEMSQFSGWQWTGSPGAKFNLKINKEKDGFNLT
jgi:hypothetical protein